ncbi:hypothetical protein M1466_03630 [Candidatus Dependentiae bacterium]|nr:hypothetical protein [Candidatus Dependentiae bacterium]
MQPQEVTGRLRMSFVSMGTIAAKYCALSILAIPVFAITSQTFALSLVFDGPSFMALYLSPYACWAVAENIQSNKCNKQLLEKVEHQTLQEMVVNPKSTIEGLLFISRKQLPRKYRSNIIACQEYIKANFKITIIDQQTRDEFALSTNNPLLSLKQAIANR